MMIDLYPEAGDTWSVFVSPYVASPSYLCQIVRQNKNENFWCLKDKNTFHCQGVFFFFSDPSFKMSKFIYLKWKGELLDFELQQME